MSGSENLANSASIFPLWLKLIEELAGVFDTHFVCSIAAAELAAFSGSTTVAAVSGPQGDYYDVWICQPDGASTQVRWPADKASFAPIINSHNAVRLEKVSRPVSELVNIELWLLSQENVVAVPLPFATNEVKTDYTVMLCLIDPPPNRELCDEEL